MEDLASHWRGRGVEQIIADRDRPIPRAHARGSTILPKPLSRVDGISVGRGRWRLRSWARTETARAGRLCAFPARAAKVVLLRLGRLGLALEWRLPKSWRRLGLFYADRVIGKTG
jgi:hypothetical protein